MGPLSLLSNPTAIKPSSADGLQITTDPQQPTSPRIFTTPPPADTHNLSITVASNISLDCTQTGQTNDKTIEFGTITPALPLHNH